MGGIAGMAGTVAGAGAASQAGVAIGVGESLSLRSEQRSIR